MLVSIEVVNRGGYEIVKWKEVSEGGVVLRINDEIMDEVGVGVMYEGERGMCGGGMVGRDGGWKY